MMMRFFYSFLFSITILLCSSSTIFAAGNSSGEEETQICSIGEEQKRSAAKGAYRALKQVKSYHNTYLKVQDEELNEGACDDLGIEGMFDGFLTSELGWGDHDEEGAEIGERYQSGLEDAFEDVEDLDNTDLDIDKYVIDVNRFIAKAYNMEKGIHEPGLIEAFLTFFTGEKFQKKLAIKKARLAEQCKPSILKMQSARKSLKEHRMVAHQYLTMLSGETPATCVCDANGNLLECTVEDDSFIEDDVEPSGCRQMNEYMADLQVCPTCGIFETILRATQNLASGAFEQLAPGLMKLLGIAFAIFLGYQVLLAVASPATQTPGKLLGTITSQGFKVALAIGLMSNPEFVYNTLITPIIYGGFDFGLEMSGDDSFQKIKQYGHKYQQFDTQNKMLTADFLKDVMGAVEAFNEAAATVPSIGRSMMCNAFVDLIWFVLPHFSLLLEGLIVYVFGMIILLSVGFYLLDSAITLGLVCCLMPLAIASWPFKMTAKYTTVCWNFVMNVFFNFVMVGIIIKVVIDLTVQAIATGLTIEELTELLDTNNVTALERAMDFSGLQMLMLVICCMISAKLIKDTNSLANKFAPGAPTGGMGAQLAGTAASIATSVGKAALGPAGKAAGAVGEATGINGAGRALKAGVKNKAGKLLGKMGIGGKAKSQGGRQNNSQQNGGGNQNSGGNQNGSSGNNSSGNTGA